MRALSGIATGGWRRVRVSSLQFRLRVPKRRYRSQHASRTNLLFAGSRANTRIVGRNKHYSCFSYRASSPHLNNINIYLYSIVANHYITMYTYVYFAGPHWNFVSPTMFVSFSKSNLVFRCIELPAKTSLSHFLHCSLDFRRHSGQLPRGGQRRGSRPNCAGWVCLR